MKRQRMAFGANQEPAGLQFFRGHPFAIGERMFDEQLNLSKPSLSTRRTAQRPRPIEEYWNI
jgi:hypothetical protein